MGTYNDFTITLTIPAARIPALAAALRQATTGWHEAHGLTDRQLVAWCLYAAEGGGDDAASSSLDPVAGTGLLQLAVGGYGTMMSGQVEAIERLYAAHGATGTIEGRAEEDDAPYLVVLADCGASYHPGQTIYPTHDPLTPIQRCLPLLTPDQARTLHTDLDQHLTAPGTAAADHPDAPHR